MAAFTINLTPVAAQRLKALVDRHNADNGTDLTVADWLTLHIKELLVQDELLAAAERLRREAEEGANAALHAERERLLKAL